MLDICMYINLYPPAPHASEPYYALATVYEDMGDKQKLLQVEHMRPF